MRNACRDSAPLAKALPDLYAVGCRLLFPQQKVEFIYVDAGVLMGISCRLHLSQIADGIVLDGRHMGGGVIVSQRQHIQKPDTGQGSAGCQRRGLGNGFPVHGEVGEGNISGADEDVPAGAAEATAAMPVLVTALETGGHDGVVLDGDGVPGSIAHTGHIAAGQAAQRRHPPAASLSAAPKPIPDPTAPHPPYSRQTPAHGYSSRCGSSRDVLLSFVIRPFII